MRTLQLPCLAVKERNLGAELREKQINLGEGSQIRYKLARYDGGSIL